MVGVYSRMAVVGIGQCALDCLAVVDRYPHVDSKKEVSEWHEQGGGPVATALVALCRLGERCTFYGVVGDDEAGLKVRRGLRGEGVNCRRVKTVRGGSSQVAFIAIERDTAKRTIFWKRATGGALTPDDLGRDFLRGATFLLLDGLMEEVSAYAARRARERGVPVMLDAGRMRPGMLELAGISDYVVAAEDFAKDLGWDLTIDCLTRERERLGVKVLTVTLGRQGSLTAAKEGFAHVPAFEVDAVDTTGAGDVFHGGYVYGLLRNWGLVRTLTFASACAAMKCTKVGGRAGIPRLEEVLAFLRERNYLKSAIDTVAPNTTT